MKHLLVLLLLCAGFCTVLAQSLIPPVGDQWELSRNARAVVTYDIAEYDGVCSFHINMTSREGYAYYCCRVHLEPGDYTLRARCRGNTRKGVLRSAYSFDAKGTPKLLMYFHGIEGIQDSEILQGYLTVPEDSASVRIDFGVSEGGECFISEPELLKGKLPVPETNTRLEPIHSQWMADWIFLKNDPGEQRIDFKKLFHLKKGAAMGVLQLTADNAYDLIINGHEVGGDTDWATVEKYDIAKYLKAGQNAIEVHLLNYDGAGGLLLQGQIKGTDGETINLLSDESWQISLPHGGPATLEKLGKVPVMPWGNVVFHRTSPPRIYHLNILDSATDVTAGDLIRFTFAPSQTLLEMKELRLKMVFTDKDGNITPLSGLDPFIRLVKETKRLYVELPTSPYAMPGDYRLEIQGEGFVIPCPAVHLKAGNVADQSGRPLPRPSASNLITNDVFTHSLFLYCTSTLTEEHVRSWTRTGGHLYECHLSSGEWLPSGIYDTANVERELLAILENDPCASVILKINVNVPGWWSIRHKDELTLTNKGRHSLQSFCSEIWRRDVLNAICKTVERLQGRPVGKAISGVLFMGFEGGEFQLWGQSVNEYDCSAPTQAAWKTYLVEHQVKKNIPLPHPALDVPFRPPQEDDAHIRDLFFRFLAERHADNMIFFANRFKERFGDRFAYGVYFGYGLEYAGNTPRMLTSGHLGFEKVLESINADYISSPLSYGLRPATRSHAFMFPVDSVRMHNILPIGENDVRNCLCPEFADGSGIAIHSLEASLQDNRRIRLFEAMYGALTRYYAIHAVVDWYNLPAITRAIRQDDALIRPLQANPVGAPGQVVLVANYLEWTRGWRLPDKIFQTFAGDARDTLMRTGRTVAFVTFADYATALKKWQYALIPAPGLLTKKQRSLLENAFGKLPDINQHDGALLLKEGKWKLMPATADSQALWKEFATPEALKAGYETIWYIGPNFKYTWDGKKLTKVN